MQGEAADAAALADTLDQRAAVAEDERDRAVTEDDVTDDSAPHQPVDRAGQVEAGPADIREIAAVEPRQTREDVVRVPTAEGVEGPVVRAQRSLAETRAREAHEQQVEADERTTELAHWHDEDLGAEREAADEPVLEYGAEPSADGP